MTSKELKMTADHWLSVPFVFLLFFGPHISTANPINRQVGISENVFITVQNDTYGNEQRVCSIDSVTYVDGDSIPTSSPCEHCICRPPGFACTIISCEYRPGCKALKRSDQCCPEYQCECEKDGKIYQNGEKILDNNNPCEVCYCQGGDVICAVIDCYWRNDCQPRYIENRCCPLYDHCPPPSEPGPTRPTIPTTTPVESSSFSWFNLSSAVYEVSTKPSTTTTTTAATTTTTALPASSTSTSSAAPESSTLTSSSPAEVLVSSQEPSQPPVTQTAVVPDEAVVSDMEVVNNNNIDHQPSPPTQSQEVTSQSEKPMVESTPLIPASETESITPSTTLINIAPILLTISPSPVDQATTLEPTQVVVVSSTSTQTPEEIQADPQLEPETVIQSENAISDKEVLVSSQNSEPTEILSSSVTSLLTETISAAVVSTPVVQLEVVDTQINIQSSPVLSDVGVQTSIVVTTEAAAQDVPVTEESQQQQHQQEQQDALIEEDRVTTVSSSIVNSEVQSEVESDALHTETEITTALPPVAVQETVQEEQAKPLEISTQQSVSVATEEAQVISDEPKVETGAEIPALELLPPIHEAVQINDAVEEIVTTNAPLQDNTVLQSELPSQELEPPKPQQPEIVSQDEPVPTTEGSVVKNQDEVEQADEASAPTTQSVLNLNDEQVVGVVDSKPVVPDAQIVGTQNDVQETTDSVVANDEGSVVEITSENSLSSKAPIVEVVPTETPQADEQVTNAQDIVSDDDAVSATQANVGVASTDSPIIFVVAPGKEGFYVSVPAKEPESLQDLPAATSSPENESEALQDNVAVTSNPEKEPERLSDTPEATSLPETDSVALQDNPEVTSSSVKEILSLEDAPEPTSIPEKELEIVQDAPAATQQPETVQDAPVPTSAPENEAVIFQDAPPATSAPVNEQENLQDEPAATSMPELSNDQPAATEISQPSEKIKPVSDFVVNLVDDDTYEILPQQDAVPKVPVILNQIKEEQKTTEDIVKPVEQKTPADLEKPEEVSVDIVQDEPSATTVRIAIKGDKEEDTDTKDGDEDTIEVSGANTLNNQPSADENTVSTTSVPAVPLKNEINIESNKQPLVAVVPVVQEILSDGAVEIFSDAVDSTTVPAEIILQNIKTEVQDENPHTEEEPLADQTVLVEALPEQIINADNIEIVEETTGKTINAQLSDEPVRTTLSSVDSLEDEHQSDDTGATAAPLVNVHNVNADNIISSVAQNVQGEHKNNEVEINHNSDNAIPLADQAVEIENVKVHNVETDKVEDVLPLADQTVEIQNVHVQKVGNDHEENVVPLADQAVTIENLQVHKVENEKSDDVVMPLADQTTVIENEHVEADENIVATTPQGNEQLNSEAEVSQVQQDEAVVTTSQPQASHDVVEKEESSLADEVVEVHNLKVEAANEKVSDESVVTTVQPEITLPINKVQKVAMVTAAKVSPVVPVDEDVMVNDQPSESATVRAEPAKISAEESSESKFRLDMSIFDDSVEEHVKSVDAPVVKVNVADKENEIEKKDEKTPNEVNTPKEESIVVVKHESPAEIKESQDEPAVVVATTPSIIPVQRGDGIANNDEILVFDDEQQTATHLPVAQSLHREEHAPSVKVQVHQSASVPLIQQNKEEAEKIADEPEHIPTTESSLKLGRDDIDFSDEIVELTTASAARLSHPVEENEIKNDEPVATARTNIEQADLVNQEKTEEISTPASAQDDLSVADETVTQSAQKLRGDEIPVDTVTQAQQTRGEEIGDETVTQAYQIKAEESQISDEAVTQTHQFRNEDIFDDDAVTETHKFRNEDIFGDGAVTETHKFRNEDLFSDETATQGNQIKAEESKISDETVTETNKFRNGDLFSDETVTQGNQIKAEEFKISDETVTQKYQFRNEDLFSDETVTQGNQIKAEESKISDETVTQANQFRNENIFADDTVTETHKFRNEDLFSDETVTQVNQIKAEESKISDETVTQAHQFRNEDIFADDAVTQAYQIKSEELADEESVTHSERGRGEPIEIDPTNTPIENEIDSGKNENVAVKLNDEQIPTTASFLLRHGIVAGDETTLRTVLQDDKQEDPAPTGTSSNIHTVDDEVHFDEVVVTSTEKSVHAERQDFVEVTTTKENGRYAAEFHDDVYGTTTYPRHRVRQDAIVRDAGTTERIVHDDANAQNEIATTNNPSLRLDAVEEADGSFSDGTTVDSDLAAVDADEPIVSSNVHHEEPQKAEVVQKHDEVVITSTVAAIAKNESGITKTESDSVVDNVEIPRISEDMKRSDINSIMSELNLKGRMSHEVSQVEEPWLWRAYNRIRNLSFFPRLTRQPRSADEETKEKKIPGKTIYPKTKKATQELPKETHKKVKVPSRSFLLW